MSRFVSRQLRYRQQEAIRARKAALGAAAVLSMSVAAFGGLFYLAAEADAAHGISVSQSLRNNGVTGAAYVAEAFESPKPATEARLIGLCGGRILAASEEDSFPAGCEWIEPIRTAGDRIEAEAAPDHSEAELVQLGRVRSVR